MELALAFRELWRRRWIVALGILVAAVAAVLSVYRLDGFTLKARSLQHSGASTQILVDTKSSVLANVSPSFEPLNSRAIVYANFMTSPVVLELISRQVGLRGDQIYAAGPVDTLQPRTVQEPTELSRNIQVTGESAPYRLNFNSVTNLPTIGVYAQAPTTSVAIALANASVVGLQKYVTGIEKAENTPAASRIAIRQLGTATGGVVNSGISKSLAALVFAAMLLLWCVLVLVGARFRASWRASGVAYREQTDEQRMSEFEPGAGAAADSNDVGRPPLPSDTIASSGGVAGDPISGASHGEGNATLPHLAGRR